MHAIHFIYLASDRETDAEALFCEADYAIESYRSRAYDSHAEGPGLWKDVYPAPVSYRRNMPLFLGILAQVRRARANLYKSVLNHLARDLDMDIPVNAPLDPARIGAELFAQIANLMENSEHVQIESEATWSARKLLEIIQGNYRFDSGFYDAVTTFRSIIPTDKEVAEVFNSLHEDQDIYLVPLDLH